MQIRPLLSLTAASALAISAVMTAAQSAAIAKRHPARGRFVRVSNVPLHLLEAGAGAPVLLIHGNLVDAEDWRRSGIFEGLADNHRVIAPDRPGYGHSARPRGVHWTPKRQAALLASLLRRLDAVPAIVVGHSLGAQIAVRMAIDHSPLVAGLILVSGYYFPSARLDYLASGVTALPAVGDIIRRTVGPQLGRALGKPIAQAMFAPRAPPRGYEREILEMAWRPLQMRAAAADGIYMLEEAGALARDLASLEVRTAVLAGANDRIVDPLAQSQRLARLIRAPDWKPQSDAGHMLHYALHESIVAAVSSVSQALGPDAASKPPDARLGASPV